MTHYVIGHKTRGAIAYRENIDHAADSLLHFMQGDSKGDIYECILACAYVLNGHGPTPRVDPELLEWYVIENDGDNYDEQYQRIIEEINGLTLKQAQHFLDDGEALQFKGIYDIDAVEHVYSIVMGFAPGE